MIGRVPARGEGRGDTFHPNIVTNLRCRHRRRSGVYRDELSRGYDLDLMRSGKELTTQEIVEIGIQLARALDYAHRRGIIHRDVKPGNIMLGANTKQVKVADFGICRIDSGDSAELTQATALGDVLGTPNYMAPEQVMGQKVDARSDLFSAGVVLYKLLTGTLPFEGDSIITVAEERADESPTIDKLRATWPLSRALLGRALRKRPQRFHTARQWRKALAGVGGSCRSRERNRRHRSLLVRGRGSWRRLSHCRLSATGGRSLPSPVPGDYTGDLLGDRSLRSWLASAVPPREDWAASRSLQNDDAQNFVSLVAPRGDRTRDQRSAS